MVARSRAARGAMCFAAFAGTYLGGECSRRRQGPTSVVNARGAVTEHLVAKARDRVVVTRFEEWGLISYARADGSWLHTANTPEGLRRKLADLGITNNGPS